MEKLGQVNWYQLPSRLAFTPSGGTHILYAYEAGISRKPKGLAAKIDTLGTGEYCIAYGGVDKYIDLPCLEDNVRQLIRKSQSSTKSKSATLQTRNVEDAVDRLKSCKVGTRNDTLNRVVFALAAHGFSRESLLPIFDTALSIGLKEHEVFKTFDSGFNAGSERHLEQSIESVRNVTNIKFIDSSFEGKTVDRYKQLHRNDRLLSDGTWYACSRVTGLWRKGALVEATVWCELDDLTHQIFEEFRDALNAKKELATSQSDKNKLDTAISGYKRLLGDRILRGSLHNLSIQVQRDVEFDSHHHLLGVKSGVVDLKTGEG